MNTLNNVLFQLHRKQKVQKIRVKDRVKIPRNSCRSELVYKHSIFITFYYTNQGKFFTCRVIVGRRVEREFCCLVVIMAVNIA